MKHVKFLLILTFLGAFCYNSISQDNKVVKPTKVSTAIYHDVFGPISDLPALTKEELEAKKDEPKKERNEELKERLYPYAATALPKGPDPAWQKIQRASPDPALS